jgi:hypothetical protein
MADTDAVWDTYRNGSPDVDGGFSELAARQRLEEPECHAPHEQHRREDYTLQMRLHMGDDDLWVCCATRVYRYPRPGTAITTVWVHSAVHGMERVTFLPQTLGDLSLTLDGSPLVVRAGGEYHLQSEGVGAAFPASLHIGGGAHLRLVPTRPLVQQDLRMGFGRGIRSYYYSCMKVEGLWRPDRPVRSGTALFTHAWSHGAESRAYPRDVLRASLAIVSDRAGADRMEAHSVRHMLVLDGMRDMVVSHAHPSGVLSATLDESDGRSHPLPNDNTAWRRDGSALTGTVSGTNIRVLQPTAEWTVPLAARGYVYERWKLAPATGYMGGRALVPGATVLVREGPCFTNEFGPADNLQGATDSELVVALGFWILPVFLLLLMSWQMVHGFRESLLS